jgi:hypothetical protein
MQQKSCYGLSAVPHVQLHGTMVRALEDACIRGASLPSCMPRCTIEAMQGCGTA